jgi:hypothetical protein
MHLFTLDRDPPLQQPYTAPLHGVTRAQLAACVEQRGCHHTQPI